MRKVFRFLFLLIAIFVLSACGGDAKNADDVLKEGIEATKKLESYSTEMNMTTEGQGVEIKLHAKGDFTHDPDTAYLEAEMSLAGMSMTVETYVVGDEIYMGAFGEWIMLSEDELGIDNYNKMNAEDLEILLEYADQFELKEEGKTYVLTLSSEGEKVEELFLPYLEAAMGDLVMDPEFEEDVFEDISIDKFEMTLTVDKKTMNFQSQAVEVHFDVDGDPHKIVSEATISNINKVDPIDIPDEVKESAEQF